MIFSLLILVSCCFVFSVIWRVSNIIQSSKICFWKFDMHGSNGIQANSCLYLFQFVRAVHLHEANIQQQTTSEVVWFIVNHNNESMLAQVSPHGSCNAATGLVFSCIYAESWFQKVHATTFKVVTN